MGDVDEEIRKAQESRGHGFGEATDDEHSTSNKFAGFESSIGTGEVEEDDGEEETRPRRQSFTAPKHLLDVPSQEGEADPLAGKRSSNRIADREDEYHARRQRVLSPTRADAFALGDKTPDVSTRAYKDVMAEQQIAREREELKRKLKEKEEKEKEEAANGGGASNGGGEAKKRRRWDQPVPAAGGAAAAAKKTRWDDVATPAPTSSRWDGTRAHE